LKAITRSIKNLGDVLFLWTTAYRTRLMRACVPSLRSGLYQLFDPCLIKRVLIVWAWTNDKCLATKHHQTFFGDQTCYRLDAFFGAV